MWAIRPALSARRSPQRTRLLTDGQRKVCTRRGNQPSSGWSGHGKINAVERLVCHHFPPPGMDTATPKNFHSNFAVDCGECPSLCGLSAAMAGDQDRVAPNRADRHRTNVAYVQGLKVHNDA